jgi:hypothetical protein
MLIKEEIPESGASYFCQGVLSYSISIISFFIITVYKQVSDRAINRVNSKQGRYMKKKRQCTVEPVFGNLINFMGLSKINTIGIKQANKVMIMAGIAYYL